MTGILILPVGIFISAIYPLCAAYRLARFNVGHSTGSFRGLPSPVAGVIVGLMPLAFNGTIQIPQFILTIIFILTGFLMVSTIKYTKPQVAGLRRFTPGRLGVLMAFIVVCLIYIGIRYSFDYAAVGLFLLVVVYIVSGFVGLIIQLIQKYRM